MKINYILYAVGIIFVLIIIGILLSLFGVLPGIKPSQPPPATITFWDMGNNADVWQPIINKFHDRYPFLGVAYKAVDPASYDDNLINALATGNGPDIFLLNNSQIEKHGDKIYPLPAQSLTYTTSDFRNNFTDLSIADLINKNNQIIGFPLYNDSLMLFYNKDLFNAAGIGTPPTTWEDFIKDAITLTEKSPNGGIKISGAAFGSEKNVSYSFDILSALIMQNGDPIISRQDGNLALSQNAVEGALNFYTSFTDPSKLNFTWSDTKENSLTALADGSAAMAIGYFSDVQNILSQNPHLNLGIALLPQIKDATIPLTYGSYNFPTVSKLSKNPLYSWLFLNFASSHDSDKMFTDAIKLVPARRDLISGGTNDPYLSAPYKSALIAKDWPLPSNIDAVKKAFIDAISSLSAKQVNSAGAAEILRGKILNIMSQ